MDSTSDVDQGEAPIAIESPNSVLGKQDLRGSHGSGAVIQVGATGLQLILTVVVTALVISAIWAVFVVPSHIENKIQAGIAQAETRIRTEVYKDVAEAKVIARNGETQGKLAKATVERLEVELGKKGFNVRSDGH